MPSYIRRKRKESYRFEGLSLSLKTDNFVFNGTSLDEEWDFDIQCRQSGVYRYQIRPISS